MAADEFDYILVGGGTAAGILAYRLGEAGQKVCVLEAGPADRNFYIKVPAGFTKTLFHPELTWQFKSDPDPATDNRHILFSQGKTLGGSSSINGMIYNRGHAGDYDHWAQLGNRGWSYDDVLPFFRRTERRLGENVDLSKRGDKGRLNVITAQWPNALETAFLKTAEACGHRLNPDYNSDHDGVGTYQSSINRGWRESTATAFLHPARKRFGVDVRTGALALKIDLEGRRATGVTYRQDGQMRSVKARREVIVTAGAVNSPKLLQISGIGPGALLQGNGIAVSHELRGVGENLRDHFGPRIVARAKAGVDSVNLHVKGLPLARQILRWMTGQSSILATSPGRLHLFGRSEPGMERPDYNIIFMPASFKAGLVGVLDDFPGMTIGCWPMRPESAGYVRISGPSADDVPHVNPRYLSADYDCGVLVAALKEARRLTQTQPLASLVDSEIFPGGDVVSDEQWIEFSRQGGSTSWHLVGTCKMGPASDALAVVGPDLKVHGLDGLRVADSSIMPMIPSANTAAPTMMIAEKASDLILGRSA